MFGRNVPPAETAPLDVLTPNPRTVSLELLTRERFVPATTLNVLAAAWLQFEVHDWFSHGSNEPDDPWLVDLDPSDPWPQHPMQIQRTHQAAPTTRRQAAHVRQHRDALVGRLAGLRQHARVPAPAAHRRAASCCCARRATCRSTRPRCGPWPA